MCKVQAPLWLCLGLLPLWLGVGACDFSASTKVDGPGGAELDDTGSAGDSGDTDGHSSEDTEDLHPSDIDDDGDGYTENEGDCDDSDVSVRPDQPDDCDGMDNNCDGSVDEDAMDDDPYEPNDTAPSDLGSLDDSSTITVTAGLHNDEDVDRYAFSFSDGDWTLFTLQLALSSIPDGATYRMTVTDDGGGELYEEFSGDSLVYTMTDDIFSNQGGSFEVAVDSLGGADCDRVYLLGLSLSQ